MVVPVKGSFQNRKTVTNNIMDKGNLVGNSKEYRIESNYSVVKIVGNSNRIFIQKNDGILEIVGNLNKIFIHKSDGILEIVGNSNNVKILRNSGEVKYVGNKGQIYIGCESIVQKVDYVGCDGVLKIPTTAELEKKIFSHDKSKKSPSTGNGGYNICIRNNVTTISSTSSAPDADSHINFKV